MKKMKESMKIAKMMHKSVIVRIVSNRYHVYHEGKTIHAIAMGKLRLGLKPVVGDEVEIEYIAPDYVIQKIHPRKNALKRPLVANIDQAFIVMSTKDPMFSYQLVDRLIFLVSLENIEPIIVLNKTDLVDESFVKKVKDEYMDSGYKFIATGENGGIGNFESLLEDKISVLAGQSGVGKSSIINRIDPEFDLKTGEVSKSLGRGRHTTRHNQLYELSGGWIADTPGFSSLDFSKVVPLELAQSVPDFQEYLGACKYRDCLHVSEPSCKIKEELELGNISSVRYENYLDCLNLIKEERR